MKWKRKMTLEESIEHAKQVAEEQRVKCISCSEEHEQLAKWLTELKRYKDLEEQGRLLKLPCKIGTEVYNIIWWDNVQEKVVVKGKTYYREFRKHKVTKSTFGYLDISRLGETVFLTKKEAEAKLKESEGGAE